MWGEVPALFTKAIVGTRYRNFMDECSNLGKPRRGYKYLEAKIDGEVVGMSL